MTTRLESFRNHCRTEAARTTDLRPKGTSWQCSHRSAGIAGHGECTWGWQGCACDCHDHQRPTPPSAADRLLWTRLADEIDRYIAGGLDLEDEDLDDVTDTAVDHTEPLWEIS